jgi:hypothetical protein
MRQPQVNEYVKWNRTHGSVEGWVYFSDPDGSYITIELSTKPMSDEQKRHSSHAHHHVLIVCHPCYWDDLTIVGSRDSKYSNTIIPYDATT